MFQTLIAQIKEYKKPSILASLFMTLEVMFEISIPFVMANLLDKGVQQSNMSNIWLYGGLMLVCAFLSLFCGMQSARYAAFASAGFAKNLRQAIFKKVQTFSFENIDKFSAGGLVTRMMTDVTNVQNSYQMIIRICVRAPLNLIFAIAASFLINGEMAWIFVGVTLFLGVVLAIITKIVYPLFTQVFEAYDNLNNSIKENITNMRVVKSYVKEQEETDKFKKASRRIYKMFMRAIRVVVMSDPAMMLSMYASFLMISWFGAHLIVVGKLSTGELTSMFSYTMTILISLMMFMMIFVMLSISMASVERINEVLNTESTIVSPENGLTEVTDGSISFVAGPAANFLTALAAVGVSSAVFHLAPLGPAAVFVLCFLSNMALLGVGMGLFNLIPLSPLDGSKILFALLPDRIYYTILRYEKYVMGVVILLVLVGVFDKPLSFLMVHVLQGFCTLTGMPLGGLLLFQDASAILNLF